jgi:endonuclease YncB( thermonuclease family)
MIIITLILTLLFSKPDSAKADPKDKFYLAFVERVKDGDTIVIKPFLKDEIFKNYKFTVRLLKSNTPELDSNSKCERELAQKASEFTKNLLPTGKKITLVVDNEKPLDAFGRILADVIVDDKSASELLLKNKLAVLYKKDVKPFYCKD